MSHSFAFSELQNGENKSYTGNYRALENILGMEPIRVSLAKHGPGNFVDTLTILAIRNSS